MTMLEQLPTNPTYAYYRQANGWITVSPATNTDELKYRRLGWTPLTQYGYIEMATAYAVNNPFEGLFMRGGEQEFSVDQIRREGFHLNPPIIPNCRTPLNQNHRRHTAGCLQNAKQVSFPQLAGRTDLEPTPCTVCDRVFSTVEGRDQHTSVMHAPEKSDQRTGESLSAALIKGLGHGPTEREERLQQQLDALLAAQPDDDAVMGGMDAAQTTRADLVLMEGMADQLRALKQELTALKASVAPAPMEHDGALQQLFSATCTVCGKKFTNVKQQYATTAMRGHQRRQHATKAVAV